MVEVAISLIHLSWMWVLRLVSHSFSYITVSQQSHFGADRGAVLLLQVSTWVFQVGGPHTSCPSKPEIWRFLCLFSLIPRVKSLWFATCPPLYFHFASSGLGCLLTGLKSVTSLVASCLYTSAPLSRLLRADSLSYPFLQEKVLQSLHITISRGLPLSIIVAPCGPAWITPNYLRAPLNS